MKIISLQPSVSIILDRLGCLDSLAACTKYCLEAVPALRERSLPGGPRFLVDQSGRTPARSGRSGDRFGSVSPGIADRHPQIRLPGAGARAAYSRRHLPGHSPDRLGRSGFSVRRSLDRRDARIHRRREGAHAPPFRTGPWSIARSGASRSSNRSSGSRSWSKPQAGSFLANPVQPSRPKPSRPPIQT